MLFPFPRPAALILALALTHSGPAAAENGAVKARVLTNVTQLLRLIEQDESVAWLGAPSNLRIVDARSKRAFDKAHLPGAFNIPARQFAGLVKSGALAQLLKLHGITRHSQVVIYDDGAGFEAARLFWLLSHRGHRAVSVLDGGIAAWSRAGRRLARRARAGG
jgi:3-mercaptopyruvate sulfurtransferase SseA